MPGAGAGIQRSGGEAGGWSRPDWGSGRQRPAARGNQHGGEEDDNQRGTPSSVLRSSPPPHLREPPRGPGRAAATLTEHEDRARAHHCGGSSAAPGAEPSGDSEGEAHTPRTAASPCPASRPAMTNPAPRRRRAVQ